MKHNKTVREITRDVANAIVRGDTMIPVCNIGPLLEYIEHLEAILIKESNIYQLIPSAGEGS